MELNFNPETQYLVFKPVYTDTLDIISVYQGQPYPAYVIDPSTCTQEEMQQYWGYGLTHLFDIVDKPV
jgi:hypothetical protein